MEDCIEKYQDLPTSGRRVIKLYTDAGVLLHVHTQNYIDAASSLGMTLFYTSCQARVQKTIWR
jgi:hypothetical protein